VKNLEQSRGLLWEKGENLGRNYSLGLTNVEYLGTQNLEGTVALQGLQKVKNPTRLFKEFETFLVKPCRL